MELTDLRYFVNVARAGSFVRGAELSHVSPPAISKTIKKLEDELGQQLFVRTTRRATLTDSGEILFAHAQRVLDEIESLGENLRSSGSSVEGELRIAANEVFSIHLLPAALSALLQEHPKIVPRVFEMIPQRIEALLREGRLDVGFTIGASASSEIDSRMLGRSSGILCVGRTHPLYARGRVRAADLSRYSAVVPRFFEMEHLPPLDQWPEERYPRRVGATIELLQMGVQLTINGTHVGYFPEITVGPELAARRLKELKGLKPGRPFELCAVTRRGSPAKAAVRALVERVAELVSK